MRRQYQADVVVNDGLAIESPAVIHINPTFFTDVRTSVFVCVIINPPLVPHSRLLQDVLL